MLITTSRKPSPRTRSFTRSLERVLNSKYINRGKMSMRDVLLKSRVLGYRKIAVISETNGNPSRIEILDCEGDSIINMDITVTNSLASGRIKKKKLHLRWQLDQSTKEIKDIIISILEIPEDPIDLIKTKQTLKEELNQYSDSNLVLVTEGETSKAVVEFHDQDGQITGPRIYIHKCKRVLDAS
jgi:U3 small nucleolar ribonucleoprotein protein IMP4